MKNTGVAIGDFEGWICPVQRFSSRKASNSICSNRDRGYTFDNLGSALGISSIVLIGIKRFDHKTKVKARLER